MKPLQTFAVDEIDVSGLRVYAEMIRENIYLAERAVRSRLRGWEQPEDQIQALYNVLTAASGIAGEGARLFPRQSEDEA